MIWAYCDYLDEVENGVRLPAQQLGPNNQLDVNVLYEAFKNSLSGSAWKAEPQAFEMDWLCQLFLLKHEVENRIYKPSKGSEFILNERGKIRYVHGKRIRDRVVGHWLCDSKINPAIQPYLIYNNGASQKGKGLSFSRSMFEKDLHNFFLKHHHNKGYVGFIDMSKFYDNIQHDITRQTLSRLLTNEDLAFWLFSIILDEFKIDVSYMTDEEYAECMHTMFNSIEYHRSIPENAKTGTRWMRKSVDIGDQISQSIGIFYPMRIDNYIKIVRGCEQSGRYMDDIYLICETREEVESIIDGVEKEANQLGLFINRKKTRIVRLDEAYQYLQVKYTLSDTGKVIKRINPKSVVRERRKMKAYKRLLDKGEMKYEDIEQACRSWMGAFAKLMSKHQIKHMKTLYQELFGKELTWKRK